MLFPCASKANSVILKPHKNCHVIQTKEEEEEKKIMIQVCFW